MSNESLPVFGKSTTSEKIAQENLTCREIVRELLTFEINQRQIFFIMYLLSLEIEDVESMREMVGVIQTLRPDIFVSSMGDEQKA